MKCIDNTKNTQILFVDKDNSCNEQFLNILNEEAGYDFKFIENINDNIRLNEDFYPELIIYSVKQFNIDDIKLTRELKSRFGKNKIPVLFYIDNNQITEPNNAFEYGYYDIISKSITEKDLLFKIKLHLKITKDIRELEVENQLLKKREQELKNEIESQTKRYIDDIYLDSLTQFPNRLKLLEDIHSSENPILILINVDSFKEINSFFGHIIGDQVLVELSRRLKNATENKNISVYKLHADEFAVLLRNPVGKQELKKFVGDLHRSVEVKPYSYEDHDIAVDISLGVANENTKDDILEKADMALKYTKRSMKNWLIYDNSMKIKKEYGENLKWARIIKNAIKSDSIITYFQPIYNNRTEKIEKYETLVRLVNSTGDVILPYFFLNIAKKSKQYNHITKAVFKKSCEEFSSLDMEFSVNVLPEDILNNEIVIYIKECIKKYNVGNRLIFEIIESENITDYEAVHKFILDVKTLGCKVAIDDFGSGYSNFEHILKLDVDFIKIDASLIERIDVDDYSRIIVETIVNFCDKLNIKTIAEKVHSESVYKEVKRLGINYSQGFYLGMPGLL